MDRLFGGNLLRNYITYIDFDHSVIELYRFGPFTYPEGGSKIPMDYSTGLPGIQAKVKLNSDKDFLAELFFDTGAKYPLIFFGQSVKKNELGKNFNVKFNSNTVSMGHSTPTLCGVFDFLELGETKLNQFTGTIQLFDQSMAGWEQGVDGSLGIDIIRKFNCFINMAAKEFYLMPNQSFSYPVDFWLGDIQFGFSNGQIVIKNVLKMMADTETPLKINDVVVSINEKIYEDFANESTLQQIKTDSKTQDTEMIINRNDQEFRFVLPSK